ncbi:MAG TPA: helix-turn-helix domain-containing protein [bacterium]|nr:helix-turn-helix domain-containing protein [bacterium]
MAQSKKSAPSKNKPEHKEKLYNIDDMAKLLNVDKRILVEWVQYRRIPYVLVNGELIRFRLSEIAKWVKHKNKPEEKFHLS